MRVSFYINKSEKNVLRKNITKLNDVDITMRDTLNLHTPILFISNTLINDMGNYVYIEQLNRYYFIDKMDFVKTDLIKLELSCDYLQTFADVILNSGGYVTKTKTLQNYSSSYNVLDIIDTDAIFFQENQNIFTDNKLYLIGAN